MKDVSQNPIEQALRHSQRAEAHPDADMLAAFAEGALLERERESVLAHLAACEECRRALHLASEAPQLSVTDLVQDWSAGDPSALERLLPLVYDELHRSARYLIARYMAREHPGRTLQATALANEVCLRLVDLHARWKAPEHFFGFCRVVMRRILDDWASQRRALKLEEARRLAHLPEADLVALTALSDPRRDPRRARIVQLLRLLGGLHVEETGQILTVPPVTILRDWKSAKSSRRRHPSE